MPFPSPGDLLNPGIKPLSLTSSALAGEFFTTSTTWEACIIHMLFSHSVMSHSLGSMDCSMQGFPVLQHLPELAQSHVHRVSDAIQPSHPLSSPSPVFSLFKSGSFQMSQFLPSGSHSIGASASASVLPTNIQDRFPLGWTGWIVLQSKGLSRVFFNTTVQKHQLFGAQLSSQSNFHIHT